MQIVTGIDDSNSDNNNDSKTTPPISLGSLSVLLLLNLACHQDPEAKLNPYKELLSKFQNSQGNLIIFWVDIIFTLILYSIKPKWN